MNRYYRHTILLLVGLISSQLCRAQGRLLINEVMQSNIDCIMDDLNEFPDGWIELYNSGDSEVNLKDYKLGIEPSAALAWDMPELNIEAKAFALLYADKENDGRHAPFRLETGKGCSVYLFDHNGNMVDSLMIAKKQPAPNIAYGRLTDGALTWGYQAEPTPGATNCGEICTEILEQPLYSTPGQVITDSAHIVLTLTMPDETPEGTQIRYTTDGSEPTADSQLYADSIVIDSTMTVRAKPFCSGYLSPRSATQSYIYLGREMTLPLISITTDDRYLNDSTMGIFARYQEDWRRPINLEYFETSQSPSVLNQICETRIQGGASRDWQVKSMALYAHKRFGEKRFKHEFFATQRPGVDNFKSILLRNAGNDCYYLYMRDAIVQRSMGEHADLDWQAWQPAIVYVNGIYKGMLNIRERSNADNIFTHYDEMEDIDMIENWAEVKEGTIDSFYSFINFCREPGHTLAEYEEIMDVQEYINFMIMEIYFNNLDFPSNNFMQWRPREEGGKWRFVAKDADFTLGLYGIPYDFETFKWYYDVNYDSIFNWGNMPITTLVFRNQMKDPDFRREFIDHMAVYMGDFLNYSHVWSIWSEMYESIKEEYPYLKALLTLQYVNYQREMTNAQRWLMQRTNHLYGQMADFYNLGTALSLSLNQGLKDEELEGHTFSMNDIPLSEGRFEGKYFSGRKVMLTGEGVSGWSVNMFFESGSTQHIECEGQTLSFVMPLQVGDVYVKANFSGQGIEVVKVDMTENASPCYDIMGRRISPSDTTRGLRLSKEGKKWLVK